jgi:hypothetical protein
MSRYYDDAPSLREIRYENGEIEEDDSWRYAPVQCDGFYMIEQYKYANSFPHEWAMSHFDGTGPEQCGNCYDYGSTDGVFLGYCLNCAIYVYNCERGPGLGLGATDQEEDTDQDMDQDMDTDQDMDQDVDMDQDMDQDMDMDQDVDMDQDWRHIHFLDQEMDQEMDMPPVESESARMAKLVAKLRECSDELDYVFRIAEGKAPPDDQRALDYFGIKK